MITCDSAQGSSTLLSEKTRMPVQPAASLHCAILMSRSRYCSCGMRLDGGQVEKTSIEGLDFIGLLLFDCDSKSEREDAREIVRQAESVQIAGDREGAPCVRRPAP